jgi:hypothetical protein
MNKKESDLLSRIDERIKSIQEDLQDLKGHASKQEEKLETVESTVGQHKLIFKLCGWIIGSSAIVSILVKGVLALIK